MNDSIERGKIMPKAAHKVVVIGHRNPDTDSICSAIAYAELKNKTSDLVCEARRASHQALSALSFCSQHP